MAKKIINTIERENEEPLETEEHHTHDIVAKVEPVRKKREMSEEQRAKQAENLRKGREAMMLKREAKIKEQAKMLHDTVVEVKQKAPKKDTKMEKLIKAVQSISNDVDDETEDEVVVVKKQRKPRKIVVVEDSDEDTYTPPPPPPPSAPAPTKPKRQYNKKTKQPVEVSPSVEHVEQKPSIIFY